MKLNTKLVAMMLTLLVISTLILFLLNQHSQNDLVSEILDSSTAVSEVLRKSVEDLTTESDAQSSKLSEYMSEARKNGIDEINIISTDGEIIDSSDPAKIGKRRDLQKLGRDRGFRAVPGKKGTRSTSGTIVKPYKLVVPVIVGDEQLGFIEMNLLLDNVREIQHANLYRRLGATVLVFLVGIVLAVYLARRYTRPIHRLAAGVQKVSAGDLSVVLPVEDRDEIGELAENFNEMVQKLREREILEKRLYEAEHLSKVGQLASGIAHEIRNPLNYISLAIDHLKAEIAAECSPAKSAEMEEVANKIKEEVRRANYMVMNFMNYGRPLKLRCSSFSYEDLVHRSLPLLEDKLREQKIRVETALDPDLPPLCADQELLRNALFNFILNGAQAMPEGGTVTLGAGYDGNAQQFRLTFADHGSGIPAEDLSRIFQPYFTTKEAGIGLGLAISDRIVRQHGGDIRVESTVGAGTTFTVTLPAAPKEISQ
jgi:signal transduction histidine kinase